MISLLSMAVHILGTAFVYILKALFSIFTWFINALFKALRLLFVVLPCTSLILVFLLVAAIFSLVSGDASRFPSSVSMYNDLRTWWTTEIYSLKGSAGYIILLLLTLLMFIPVVTVLLCISVILSHGSILFIGIVFDAAIYLVRLIFGKGFVAQALDRYYRLFPAAGRRHEERYHDQLLRRRNRELEKELEESHRSRKGREFYGDNEDDYEEPYYEYDDDFGDDSDDRYIEDDRYGRRHLRFRSYDDYDKDDEEYEDEEFDDEEFDDEEFDDEEFDDEYYEDEEFEDIDDESRNHSSSKGASTNPGSFDFFAGCNSRESADRKYKSLVKLYHPDNMDGDTAALQEINAQYAEVKKKFG